MHAHALPENHALLKVTLRSILLTYNNVLNFKFLLKRLMIQVTKKCRQRTLLPLYQNLIHNSLSVQTPF